MYKEEFYSVKRSTVLAFDKTYGVHLLNKDSDKIFYVLTKKFLNHINSFSLIMNGTSFDEIPGNTFQIDHSSAKVLLRAAFESYLTISHLFFNEPLLTDFRVLIYKYSGLKERKEKLPSDCVENKLIEKIRSEQNETEQLEILIYELGEKLDIKKSLIKKTLNEGWRAGNGWIKIGEQSSLPSKYVKSIYPYLCGYSHSGYESYIQLVNDEGLSILEREYKQSILYFYAAFLVAHFCESYVAFTTSKFEVDFDQLSNVGGFLHKYESIYS
ncbi:hypothetical protein VCSRO172_3383 [Vibrio cholerae]|nr:hypothetical protein VCSRO172_3383 [Vibrio cholerae]